MRSIFLAAALVLAFTPAACSDSGGGERDATADTICTPGQLRCDPDGRPWIQQCNEDGTAWVDHVECHHLCHDGICFPPLDAGSD